MNTDDPFARLEERRLRRDAERLEISKRLSRLNEEAAEDEVAGRVLRQLYPEKGADSARPPRQIEPLRPVATMQQEVASVPVKDMILTVLRDSYPNGCNAKNIRGKVMLRYRKEVNPNTLTVTLVRFAKKGVVRSEGRFWFYVRASNGHAIDVAKKAKSPDVTGLL